MNSAATLVDFAEDLEGWLLYTVAHQACASLNESHEIHSVRTGLLRRVDVAVPVLEVEIATVEPMNAVTQRKFERFADSCRPVGCNLRFQYFSNI